MVPVVVVAVVQLVVQTGTNRSSPLLELAQKEEIIRCVCCYECKNDLHAVCFVTVSLRVMLQYYSDVVILLSGAYCLHLVFHITVGYIAYSFNKLCFAFVSTVLTPLVICSSQYIKMVAYL